MIVIGFTGPAGAGKDTAANMLADYLREQGLTVRVQAWADKLKVSAARSLGVEGTEQECIDWCDDFKVNGGLQIYRRRGAMHTLEGRQFLEFLGTEGGRDVHGQDVWIDLALPDPDTDEGHQLYMHGPDVVIDTTTRFPNEVDRIRRWNGKIIRIERDEYRAPESGHASRAGISREECDGVIINDGTLGQLRATVAGVYEDITRFNKLSIRIHAGASA